MMCRIKYFPVAHLPKPHYVNNNQLPRKNNPNHFSALDSRNRIHATIGAGGLLPPEKSS
jgi:hypothetical protein